MPPRRSSRAPSATPAPISQSAAPAKRKRGQTAANAANAAEDEHDQADAKPASRARRTPSTKASSSAAPKGRVASRGKAPVLANVEESDEGEEEEDADDAPPVRKRSRPSLESDLHAEDNDEEDEVVVAPKKRGGRKAAHAQIEEEDDEDEQDDAPPAALPKRRTSRQPSAGPSRRASGSSTARSRGKGRTVSNPEPVAEEDEEEEDEQEEEIKPKKRGGRAGKQAAVSDDEDDQEEELQPSEDEEDSDVPKPKGRKGKAKAAPRAAKGKKAVPQKVVVVGSDDEDSDSPPPPPKTPKKTPATPRKPSQPQAMEEEEEEKSLFEPAPMPSQMPATQIEPEEDKGPKPRLVIHKLALVNFKSYAGRQEIGPFHKSFSAIVGPNGSGKSNTIDALLFVFGFKATKMRQGKLSELIHNSAAHPDLPECSVEVHFREIIDLPGPDAFEVVPGSRLVVSRSANRANVSHYFINGRKESRQAVVALLKSRDIDLEHNRFLILQGEVESIAQMKSKAPSEHEDGLLEYLEDIIGTTELKKPIEEAQEELEKLHEERAEKMNKLRFVEQEKAALEDSRREAINFYKMKNDHVRAQSKYFQWLIFRYLEKGDELAVDKAKLTKTLEDEASQNKDNLDHLEQLKTHYATIEETFAEIKVEAEKAVKDLKDTEKEVVGLQEKKKHAEGRVKKLKKSIAEETTALKAAHHDIKDAAESLKKNESIQAEEKAALVEEERKLAVIQESLAGKTQVFHDQIQAKQKELQPWKTKIDAKQAEIDLCISERDTLAQRAKDRADALEEAEGSLAELESIQSKQVNEQGGFRAKKEQLKADIAAATARVGTAQKNFQEWKDKASSVRNRFEEARASQAASRSQGTLVNKLQSLKDQGRLNGFHGKLGTLGAIDAKYDVAISTACGGPLSNLVVDTVAEGRTCIDYLRANNLGRASFMVLEKVSESNRMNKFPTPENVPRLFDLVKPKHEMYRKAFYKAIGDCLVANDLEQARRVAFGAQRFRVVTLAGEIVDASGTMSGGGQPSRGAMSAKQTQDGVSPETLRKYEVDANTAAEELRKATEELREAEGALEGLKGMGPELEMAFQKLGMEITTRKAKVTELERRVKDLRSQNKPDAADVARIKALDKSIKDGEAKVAALQEKADEISETINKLEAKIMEIGGAKLMSQKSRVDSCRTKINLAAEAITKAETTQNRATRDVQRLTVSLEKNEAELEEVGEELEKLNEDVRDRGLYRDELKDKYETAQSELENSKETLDEVKVKLDAAEDSIAGYRKREMALKQELANVETDIASVELGINKYEELHDKLRLHDIEEDEDDDDSDDEDGAASKPGKPEDIPMDEGDDQEDKVKSEGAPRKPAQQNLGLKTYSAEELRPLRQKELMADTELLDEKIKNAKVDLTVLKEYKKREADFDNRAKDVDEVNARRDAAKENCDRLAKERLDKFMAGFHTISLKLKEMYQMITLGGNAELELVDSMDPFSEGIIFSVMPPKKSWKNISNLSGGEKTLSSLALVFALHVYKPTPLYFMDEIDAALDFRNVSIVANYIKDRTKNAQFIIISLRNDMFELSHRLIGIYKTSNATRSISINNHKLLTTVPADANNSPQTQMQQQQAPVHPPQSTTNASA